MAENVDFDLAETIKKAGWWQGSILPESCFNGELPTGTEDGWWIITSQTCNLYNPNFSKIPVFELVAAKKIDCLDRAFSRGNNPRLFHVEAMGDGEKVYFEVDIQKRAWMRRTLLPHLGSPVFEILDATRDSEDWLKNQWLDSFSGWISRSYTRVTLPDDFNSILKESKIQPILDKKLQTNALYGIYFSISSAADEEWTGNLGLMPPPYYLEILLVTDEEQDPTPVLKDFKIQLFDNKAKFNLGSQGEEELTRATASKRLGLTIVPAGVTGKNIAETTLLEIKSHIRYTLNDYLSRAGADSDG